MMLMKARNLSSRPSGLGNDEKTPRLPTRPTTCREPRPRATPLASESDPHPVCQMWSATAREHDSTRKRAPRGGDCSAPRRALEEAG